MNELKRQVRELLIAAKMLQIFADIFAVFGIFLFAYIYFTAFKDNPYAALQSPHFVVIVLIPFIPAAIMAFQAARKRQQVRSLLEDSNKTT